MPLFVIACMSMPCREAELQCVRTAINTRSKISGNVAVTLSFCVAVFLLLSPLYLMLLPFERKQSVKGIEKSSHTAQCCVYL